MYIQTHTTCYDPECDLSEHDEADQSYRLTNLYEAKRHAQMVASQVSAWDDDQRAIEAHDQVRHSNMEVPY